MCHGVAGTNHVLPRDSHFACLQSLQFVHKADTQHELSVGYQLVRSKEFLCLDEICHTNLLSPNKFTRANEVSYCAKYSAKQLHEIGPLDFAVLRTEVQSSFLFACGQLEVIGNGVILKRDGGQFLWLISFLLIRDAGVLLYHLLLIWLSNYLWSYLILI